MDCYSYRKLKYQKWFAFITVGLTLVLTFIGGEVLIRLIRPYYTPDTIRANSLEYTSSIFSRSMLKPKNRLVVNNSDSQMQYFINEYGFRSPSFPIKKPPGERRIIILGGSAVFDLRASDESSQKHADWPFLVERDLKHRGYDNVRVINAGIPGHASFDSLGRLYSQIWMFEPDFVLLYNAWNDIKYFRKLTPDAPLISLYHPYDEKANPYINYSGVWDRLFSYSQLYMRARSRFYAWTINIGKEGNIEAGGNQDDYPVFGPKQYKLNIELFVDACRDIGAVPILLTQATLVAKDNTENDHIRISYHYPKLTHDTLVRAYEETYQIMRVVGKEKEASVLDLAIQFNGQRDMFVDHVHTTPHGSKHIAKAVADFLVPQLNNPVIKG